MLRNWSIHWPVAAFVAGAIVGSTLLTGELQNPCTYNCVTQFALGKDKIFHAAAFAALGFFTNLGAFSEPNSLDKAYHLGSICIRIGSGSGYRGFAAVRGSHLRPF